MVGISMVSADGLGGHNQRQRRKELISYGAVAFLILFSFNLYQRGGEDIYEIGTAFSSLSSSSSSSNIAGGGGGGGSSGIDPNMKSSEAVATTKNTAIITESFRAIGKRTGTDKIQGYDNFESCIQKGKVCIYPDAERETCRPWGHFYDTIYERVSPVNQKKSSLRPVLLLFGGTIVFDSFTYRVCPSNISTDSA